MRSHQTRCLKRSQDLVPHVHPSLVDKLCSLRGEAGETLAPAVLLEIIPSPGRTRATCGVRVQRHCCEGHEAMEVHLVAFLSAREMSTQGTAGSFPGWVPKAGHKGTSQLGQPNRVRASSYAVCCATAFPSAWPYGCAALLLRCSQQF